MKKIVTVIMAVLMMMSVVTGASAAANIKAIKANRC